MSFGNEREFIDYQQSKEGKEQAMKCPMLTMYAATFKTPEEFKDRDCLKEECAWWGKDIVGCSILGLEASLSQIGVVLLEMKDKMPHAGQFTK